MKKLFYIVLVVVILMVAGSFVKKNLRENAAPVVETTVEVVEGCDCDADFNCEPEDNECLEKRVECGCDAAPVDGVPAEEVEEENPELTQDEGETIITE